jgi:gliding motility-associated lipoprotein GldH
VKTVYPVLVLFFLLPSCGPKIIHEEKISFTAFWTYDDKKSFSFEIKDTLPAYDLMLNVTHDKDFAFQNLYTKVTTTFPDDKKVDHVISFNLTNERNQWVGDCGNKTCTASLVLSENIYFNLTGKYEISIESYGRKDSIQGIRSFEFVVSERKKP